MIELYKLIFVFCAGFTACALANLVFVRRGDKKLKLLQCTLIVLLCLPSISAYFKLLGLHELSALQRISQSLTWTYGPLLYLSARLIVGNAVSWELLGIHLFFPLFTLFCIGMGISILPTGLIHVVVMLLFLVAYVSATIRLFTQHKARIQKLISGHRYNTYYWHLFLIAGLVFLIVYDLVLITMFYQNLLKESLFITLISSGLCLLASISALLSLFQPGSESIATINNNHNDLKSEIEPEHRVHQLTAQAANSLKAQLQELMENEKLFLDETLTLESLANSLVISRYWLSELLNIHMKTSFYEYLNEKRYEEAVKMLRDPNLQLSISDIAYSSGFNNRNSFYQTFKLKTAMTPTEFRKQAAKQS
ncbi:helix-turn-helix transcriptional regulator [Aliiglaciecola sp. M165]|nr:helix-turn-helix transcriptional regulator [Aliiglaciecola sp. M165]